MFSFKSGRPIAKIAGGKYNGEILYLKKDEEEMKCCKCKRCSKKCLIKPCCKKCNKYLSSSESEEDLGDYFEIDDGKMIPIPKVDERSVDYIAGPSGSGKTTYSTNLARAFKKIYPEKDFLVFSRADIKNDPAFAGMRPAQVIIDESFVENPIDITKELTAGCLILFDDCNTIPDDKQKRAVDKLMADIMEVGRKLGIWIIITNHLVIPNERKVARTIMNEMQSLTVFPQSGSSQQIRYCLKQYYGLNNKQIDQILAIPSRWITVSRHYPMFILHEKGAFIL